MVEVVVRGTAGAVDTAWLEERLQAALSELRPGSNGDRITVQVVDDARMAALHARHKGQSGPTDVLAFPAGSSRASSQDSSHGGILDADIAVNADEADRQARDRGHSVDQELLLYALHGTLHCAGYDDHDAAGAGAMHAEEDRILTAIGVGATFAPGPRRGRDEGQDRSGGGD